MPFVSESAQWQRPSWADHSRGAGRHSLASFGTLASAALRRAGPAAYCAISASRSVRESGTRQLPASFRRRTFASDSGAKPSWRSATPSSKYSGGDLPAGELEDAHSREADLAAGAPRDGVAHGVAERPLRGRAPVVLDHALHRPGVVAALVEHALEHRAEGRVADVLAEEGVAVAPRWGEARDERRYVLAVERHLDVPDDAHRDNSTQQPATAQLG